MLKTKKLTLNKEKLKTLVDSNLERVQGGVNISGSMYCSSGTNYGKCTPNSTVVMP